ncbi:putative membrane protein [Operophtera brumata]|uniref:Putative membrane protein n=1 Tax=Operophtera brumata TaxID=104452 RepID=A0A0L7LPA0_OPEBR|nr:putative membrane protein [Operophtera brumata]
MAQKLLESAVRELHKLVSGLSDKVESLESKVSEQSALIVDQIDIIKSLKTKLEGSISTQMLPTPAHALTQPNSAKPIRQSRLVASSKITQSGTTVATKKMTAKNDKVRLTTAGAVTPKCDKAKEGEPTGLPITTDVCGLASRVTTNPVAARTNDTHTYDEGDWKQVSRKRRPATQRRILTGSGQTANELQTAERLKYIQAWSFKPETTVELVRNHINKIAACEKYVVEKRDIRTDQHAAFVIGFPETYYDVLCTADAWPLGIKISDWFRLAPRHSERGSPAVGAAARRNSVTSASGGFGR